jgi:hypothetical protein
MEDSVVLPFLKLRLMLCYACKIRNAIRIYVRKYMLHACGGYGCSCCCVRYVTYV